MMLSAACLLISAAFFAVHAASTSYRVIYFLDSDGVGVSGELRRVPMRKGKEQNIELLLDEMILGPVDIGHRRLFPRDVRIGSVLFRHGRLYVDISPSFIYNSEESGTPITETLRIVERTIRYNFPEVDEILFFIGGKEI
jgi:hypothetical protein